MGDGDDDMPWLAGINVTKGWDHLYPEDTIHPNKDIMDVMNAAFEKMRMNATYGPVSAGSASKFPLPSNTTSNTGPSNIPKPIVSKAIREIHTDCLYLDGRMSFLEIAKAISEKWPNENMSRIEAHGFTNYDQTNGDDYPCICFRLKDKSEP